MKKVLKKKKNGVIRNQIFFARVHRILSLSLIFFFLSRELISNQTQKFELSNY